MFRLKMSRLLSMMLTVVLIFVLGLSTCVYAQADSFYSDEPPIEEVIGNSNFSVNRIYGSDRYETAFAAADRIFARFDRPLEGIVIANGQNYPDALTSTKITDSTRPLILTSSATESRTLYYVRHRVKAGGDIYLIGGTGVISQGFENTLKSEGYKVKRLGGKDRYETNLKIMEEVRTGNADFVSFSQIFIVVSGKNFADALSASSVGSNLLLVGDKLTESQKQFLSTVFLAKFIIIGGDGAVSPSVEQELKAFAPTERIAGSNRYETSELVAMKCFNSPQAICFVSGNDFADGIVAGSYLRGFGMHGPVVLASNQRDQSSIMRTYIGGFYDKPPAYVFGGPKLISDDTIAAIMSVE